MLKPLLRQLFSNITDQQESRPPYSETKGWKKVNRFFWYFGNIMKLIFRILSWAFLDTILVAMIIGVFRFFDSIIPLIF